VSTLIAPEFNANRGPAILNYDSVLLQLLRFARNRGRRGRDKRQCHSELHCYNASAFGIVSNRDMNYIHLCEDEYYFSRFFRYIVVEGIFYMEGT